MWVGGFGIRGGDRAPNKPPPPLSPPRSSIAAARTAALCEAYSFGTQVHIVHWFGPENETDIKRKQLHVFTREHSYIPDAYFLTFYLYFLSAYISWDFDPAISRSFWRVGHLRDLIVPSPRYIPAKIHFFFLLFFFFFFFFFLFFSFLSSFSSLLFLLFFLFSSYFLSFLLFFFVSPSSLFFFFFFFLFFSSLRLFFSSFLLLFFFSSLRLFFSSFLLFFFFSSFLLFFFLSPSSIYSLILLFFFLSFLLPFSFLDISLFSSRCVEIAFSGICAFYSDIHFFMPPLFYAAPLPPLFTFSLLLFSFSSPLSSSLFGSMVS